MEKVDTYTRQLTEAAMYVGHSLQRENYAMQFAKEYGYGLACCGLSEEQVIDTCKNTYGSILVRCTGMKPPFDMKIWAQNIMKGWKSYEKRK